MLECLKAQRRKPLRLFLMRGSDGLEGIRRAARAVPIEDVTRDALDRMAKGQVHQGAILQAAPVPLWDLRAWLVRGCAPDAYLVILDEVVDPQNFGGIIRSAAALGAAGVVFGKDRAAPVSSAAVKASTGAVEHIDLIQVSNIPNALKLLQEHGFWMTGLAGEAEKLLWEIDLTGKVALVMGSEGSGLRRLVRERCDNLAKIPMTGAISSLNVGSCAAVALTECVRQRDVARRNAPK